MRKKMFCGLVRPLKAADSRVLDMESALASCSRVVKACHGVSGIKSSLDFFKEFMRVHRRGSGCRVGSACISAPDAEIMMRIKDIEVELLGHFSRMISMVVAQVSMSRGRVAEDFNSEAYEAFFHAMLNYDGSVRFSTYLHNCLRRKILHACSEDSTVRIPSNARKLSMRVIEKMNTGQTFDEATDGLKEGAMRIVLASFKSVQTATDLEVNESEMAKVEDKDSFEWVDATLKGVDLTLLERVALRGFMDSPTGVMGLSSALKGLINPNTGKEYSRAAISAAWAKARKKIRAALEAA